MRAPSMGPWPMDGGGRCCSMGMGMAGGWRWGGASICGRLGRSGRCHGPPSGERAGAGCRTGPGAGGTRVSGRACGGAGRSIGGGTGLCSSGRGEGISAVGGGVGIGAVDTGGRSPRGGAGGSCPGRARMDGRRLPTSGWSGRSFGQRSRGWGWPFDSGPLGTGARTAGGRVPRPPTAPGMRGRSRPRSGPGKGWRGLGGGPSSGRGAADAGGVTRPSAKRRGGGAIGRPLSSRPGGRREPSAKRGRRSGPWPPRPPN